MNIELKPCPFCGATPATNCFGSEGVFPEMACVICINEECASRPEVWGESEEAAAEAWNTRAAETPNRERIIELVEELSDLVGGV